MSVPEIKGIYYFYDNEYDPIEYKKVIEFRNLKKVKRSVAHMKE